MYYKIDNGEVQSIDLDYYDFKNNNNYFESRNEYDYFDTQSINIEGLTVGTHTIAVWFECDIKDDNGGNNYVATFTVCDATKTVNYIDENGETKSVTANVLANGANTSEIDAGWYVVTSDANFNYTLSFTGNTHLILADNAHLNVKNGEGICTSGSLSIYGQSTGTSQGTISITNGEYGIYAGNGNININDVTLSTTNCDRGICANNGNINIYGGTIIPNGDVYGIGANSGQGTITLSGGTVTASNYSGIVKIMSGLVYSDGTNNDIKGNISDVSTIANKTLTLYGYSYLDENGDELTKTTNEVTVINSGNKPNTLGDSDNMENDYWYVITGNNVVYDDEVNGYGNIHLILADGANITIDKGLHADGSLTIYGQSEDSGTLSVEASAYGIYVEGEITINGGIINATGGYYGIYTEWSQNYAKHDITINGGTVTANGESSAINTDYNIFINGGTIIANGDYNGISANDLTIKGGKVIVSFTSDGDEICGVWSTNNIYIYDGEIYVNVNENGEPIEDAGSNGIGASNNIYIYDGTVISAGIDSGLYTDYEDIIINGGNVTAIATGTYEPTISSYLGNVIINGGDISASGVKCGIHSKYDTTINGGYVTATGGENGISASNTILAGGTVKASSYDGVVQIADGIQYSDGTTTSATFADLDATKTLTAIMPNTYELTAKLANGNYWTSFYFGSLGFKINNDVNACAYTATYDAGTLTLNKLGEDGKSIPQNTAVIIVSSTSSVSMTPDSSLDPFSGSNSLRGVDVGTATDYITTLLGSGMFYVMGSTSAGFGFHQYTGTTMPARKAFLLIDGSNEALARGITMVFENSTGIKSIDKGQIGTESDAWYSLDGRKLSQKPTTKGVYINNGKKIVIK